MYKYIRIFRSVIFQDLICHLWSLVCINMYKYLYKMYMLIKYVIIAAAISVWIKGIYLMDPSLLKEGVSNDTHE
jgi:hypothetical protein